MAIFFVLQMKYLLKITSADAISATSPGKGEIVDTPGDLHIYSLTRYVYDGLNRLLEMRQYLRHEELKTVDNLPQTSPFVTRFQYDEYGNKISETDAEGRVTTKKYDSFNRVTEIDYPVESAADNATVENRLQIIYDPASNKRTLIDPEGYWAEEIKDWNGNVVEVAKYEKRLSTYTPGQDLIV